MITTTLYKVIQSELINEGFNEFVDSEGNLVYFEKDSQFMTKILSYDNDVSIIINDLFSDLKLDNNEHDKHFKRSFLYRFINRNINRQTIEAFKLELLSTFMSNQEFLNRVYTDMEKYINQVQENDNHTEQLNKQLNDGKTTTDNRSAFADLPQSSTNLDVNSTVMEYPSDNTISRNKQTNIQETDGETITDSKTTNKTYNLDELLKSNGLLENMLNIFDIKCFTQIW